MTQLTRPKKGSEAQQGKSDRLLGDFPPLKSNMTGWNIHHFEDAFPALKFSSWRIIPV